MKHGDQVKIAEETGLSKGYVSNYFNGIKKAKPETIETITKAMEKLNIDHYECKIKRNKHRKNHLPDRWDIYNNLLHGDLSKIAKKLSCSVPLVKYVLEGKIADHKGIIYEAELMAAINIWKERFCKFKSEL